MILGLFFLSIIVGVLYGIFQTKNRSHKIIKETPTLVATQVKILSTRKYGINGFITFEDEGGNRFEILARSGIVPISTYRVGDTGLLKQSQNELVSFVRDKN